MKKLQNNFTTPDQSKRLLELGVPADSADQIYYDDAMWGAHDFISNDRTYSEIVAGYENITIPCWSAGRLIEIYRILANCGCCIQYNDDIIETLIWDIKAGMFDERDFSKLEE